MSPRPRFLTQSPSLNHHYHHQQHYRDDCFTSRQHSIHYAQPLRSPYDDSIQSAAPENMLRRKTPNGTLNGAYESSNHEVPAAKHVLIHRNDSMSQYRHTPQLAQMDSVLNQQTAPPTRYANPLPHPFYGHSYPNVMQPPFQHLDPTASGSEGRGPYGPYWNDGTYVPYRPAALRDPRFYAHDQQYPAHGFANPWNITGPGLVYPASTQAWPAYSNGLPAGYPPFAGGHGLTLHSTYIL